MQVIAPHTPAGVVLEKQKGKSLSEASWEASKKIFENFDKDIIGGKETFNPDIVFLKQFILRGKNIVKVRKL